MAQDTVDFHEEEVSEKSFDPRLMWRLLGYLKPYLGLVMLAFVLIMMASVAMQAGPYLTKIAIDDYILKGDLAGLHQMVLLFVVLLVVQFTTYFVQNYITQMTGQRAMYDLRNQIFTHLQKLPLKFFDRTPIGRLMTRNTNDVDALNELFTDGVVVVFNDIFTLLAILLYMFHMDSALGLVACSVIPVMFLVTFWVQGKMLRAFRRARSRLARLNAYLQENISGMSVVQLFNREVRNMVQFRGINRRYLDANLESTFYNSIYFPVMEMLVAITIGLILWFGASDVVEGRIEWGILVAMLQYIPRFFWPILEISERYAILQAAMASSERIFELLDTEPEPAGGDWARDSVAGEIEFDGVWFAYVEKEWVLKDVSFLLKPGEKVAIVGATGSGKSTIINLLCRFYDIQKGTIRVDGVDIREWEVESLRRRIGIVQQDVFLFSGDIASNIRLSNDRISQDQVMQAARDVNAAPFIEKLSNQYAHVVSERGSTLSVGQRQLLAFARALAFDPDILVLDEATSSVDTETETWIQQAVDRLMENRTSIVIAHRISTIRKADTIIALHQGTIREKGTHDELMAVKGFYYRLHQLQYLARDG
ncbi:MAG: ABC transporter ATP-binding protein [bacterium]|nr:ABC transporter ATP-binding protein [bacterium]